MIDPSEHRPNRIFRFDLTMEPCSDQCLRRTLYAVLVGVSPIVICLLLIAFARLVLYRLELSYNRRLKPCDRRPSFAPTQSGRLALSYTPVSHAELQRIIQGEYQTQSSTDVSRKTPRFIKSILPKRETVTPSPSILANLVIRRDAMDASSLTGILTPITTPYQPTFTIVNEKDSRRPSVITITRESVETTTTLSEGNNHRNSLTTNDYMESEPISLDPLMATTKTMKTTTVVVEEFLEFHSVSSVPCALSLLSSITENDNERNSDPDKENDDDNDQC